jgi:hypothetical protein
VAAAAWLAGAAFLVDASDTGSRPEIRFRDSPQDRRFGTVEVVGLGSDALSMLRRADLGRATWESLFPVFTAPTLDAARAAALPPVLGRYEIGREAVRFVPRFPLGSGLDFAASFNGPRFDELTGDTRPAPTPLLTLTFRMPEPEATEAARVAAVYPSAAELPENLLRLYVHFTTPMRARDVHRYVHLYDAEGDEVELPFVEVRQGLWDPAQTRLTLLFHPGRVKRGVGPNLVMGPPLREGEDYRLVIEAAFPDATGEPLAAGFEKSIHVAAPDRRSPDPAEWRVSGPAGGRDPVVVRLPEPLDHALLHRLLSVEGPQGAIVAGEVVVSDGETRWSFEPAAPWRSGDHVLRVDPALEDLAGNRIDRLFDEQTSAADRVAATAPGPPDRIVARFRVP